MPMQQDAEECWSELVSVLRAKLPKEDQTGRNFIEKYMTGEMRSEYVEPSLQTCYSATHFGIKTEMYRESGRRKGRKYRTLFQAELSHFEL